MAEDRSFITKPARGWLHSDQLITKDGINYDVEYIGCVEVLTSMKSLDFETRSQVAKECIWRACEESGTRWRRGASSSSNATGNTAAALGAAAGGAGRNGGTIQGHHGVPARLTVSSRGLRLCAMNGTLLAQHDMPRISFASGGDSDTSDFVAYVAKNLQNWRACYVLHCAKDAQEVIATIGQAFELRFKEFLTKPHDVARGLASGSVVDLDYYNDMPGKIPPQLIGLLGQEEEDHVMSRHGAHHYVNQELPPPTPLTATLPPPTPVAAAPVAATTSATPETDAFDMRPFGGEEDTPSLWDSETCCADEGLSSEPWFHGPLGRADAEKLLIRDGDFLVRLSRGGQLVLSGARGSRRHHLLLVDPSGRVRTRDRSFRSVPHLVRYHADNRLPILSADSALLLLNPVNRQSVPTTSEAVPS